MIRKRVSYEEQIMCKEKYTRIVSCNLEGIVHYLLYTKNKISNSVKIFLAFILFHYYFFYKKLMVLQVLHVLLGTEIPQFSTTPRLLSEAVTQHNLDCSLIKYRYNNEELYLQAIKQGNTAGKYFTMGFIFPLYQ